MAAALVVANGQAHPEGIHLVLEAEAEGHQVHQLGLAAEGLLLLRKVKVLGLEAEALLLLHTVKVLLLLNQTLRSIGQLPKVL